MIKPIIEGIDKLLLVNTRPTKAPPIDKGNAIKIVKGCSTFPNNKISTPKIQMIPTVMATTKPPNNSDILSAWPWSMIEIPSGILPSRKEGRFFTASTRPPSSPPATWTLMVMERSRSKRMISEGPVPKDRSATSPTRAPALPELGTYKSANWLTLFFASSGKRTTIGTWRVSKLSLDSRCS